MEQRLFMTLEPLYYMRRGSQPNWLVESIALFRLLQELGERAGVRIDYILHGAHDLFLYNNLEVRVRTL